MAKNYGIAVDEIRPWHYHDPYFAEVPAVLGDLPESVYKPIDTLKVCREFYDGIGMPIDDVLKRSDLYEQPGKCPHAFETDIDREGDNVRILVNIVPGREWLATTLHELGHASYSKYLPRNCPTRLRVEAHALTTEGVAMMFERFAQNVDWLQAMGAKVPDPERFRAAAAKLQRNRLLIFARWCQVMFRFERELYANPDQDLNRLWWELVEKYQEVKRPEGRDEPDFAAKYHFVGAPAYYHNYMMGELFASQVHHALIHAVLPGTNPAGAIYVGNKKAGEFMRDSVYSPGLTLNWNELTRHATGEELNAKAFAEDIKAARLNRWTEAIIAGGSSNCHLCETSSTSAASHRNVPVTNQARPHEPTEPRHADSRQPGHAFRPSRRSVHPLLRRDVGAVHLLRHEGAADPLSDQGLLGLQRQRRLYGLRRLHGPGLHDAVLRRDAGRPAAGLAAGRDRRRVADGHRLALP